jgi:hypothetical protein
MEVLDKHIFPSVYIKELCKHEIHHSHYTISGYHNDELSSVLTHCMNVSYVVGHE